MDNFESYINYDVLYLIYQEGISLKTPYNQLNELLKFRLICMGFNNYLHLYDIHNYEIEIKNPDEGYNLMKINKKIKFEINFWIRNFNDEGITWLNNLISLNIS